MSHQFQAHPNDSRQPSRRCLPAPLAAVALLVGTLAIVTATPAGAVAVSDEAQLRAAFADPTETLISLTADIDLVDCAAGSLVRDSAVALLVEGNGFRISQTCAGHRIMTLTAGGSLYLDELILTDGDIAGGGGGAIDTEGSVTVGGNSVLSDNTAAGSGGAIRASGAVTVVDSLLTHNGGSAGGAIYSDDHVNVIGSTFFNNTSSANGGAIWAEGVDVHGSTFLENGSGSHGGAISTASLVGSGSTFTANRAAAGGAVNVRFHLQISGMAFTLNEADTDGGAIVAQSGGSIADSTFDRNTAVEWGGAVASTPVGSIDLDVTGSSFVRNTAERGGAIGMEGTLTIEMTHFDRNAATASVGGALHVIGSTQIGGGSTFTTNAAPVEGGAIYSNPSLSVVGAEFVGNAASAGGAILAGGEATLQGTSFRDNTAASMGGAVFAEGPLTMLDSSFTDNEALAGVGGAVVSLAGGSATGVEMTGNETPSNGGAWYAAVDTAVEASRFSSNEGRSGGAIYVNGLVAVAGSTFEDNVSTVAEGGAIYAAAELTVTGSAFDRNEAVDAAGGAIFSLWPLPLHVEASRFAENVSSHSGGAIHADGSDSTILTSTFIENRAGHGGGAVAAVHGALTVDRSLFGRNESGSSGGAVYSATGPLFVDGSTFLENRTPDAGGAISAEDAAVVRNSTFVGNESGAIGGAIASLGELSVEHATIVDNTALGGAGIGMVGGELSLFASVLVNPAAANCGVVGASMVSGGYNWVSDDSCLLSGPGDLEGAPDPQLDALADNGGDTPTMLPVETSSLVDAIPLAACHPSVAFDQRGVGRPSGVGCDIGAVEIGLLGATGDDGAPGGGPGGGPGGPGGGPGGPGGGPGGPGEPPGPAGGADLPNGSDGAGAAVEGVAEQLGATTLPRTGASRPLGALLVGLTLVALGCLARRFTGWDLADE